MGYNCKKKNPASFISSSNVDGFQSVHIISSAIYTAANINIFFPLEPHTLNRLRLGKINNIAAIVYHDDLL